MHRYHFLQNNTNTSDIILEIIELREGRLREDKAFVIDHASEFNMDLLNARIRLEEQELKEIREDLKHKLEEEKQTHDLTKANSNVTFMLAKMQDLIEHI